MNKWVDGWKKKKKEEADTPWSTGLVGTKISESDFSSSTITSVEMVWRDELSARNGTE